MSWNYRVLKHVAGEEEWYQIHDVYYRRNGSIRACSEEAHTPFGETVEELQEEFKLMKIAFDMPTIPYEDI
jgi:hypothetical protein